MKTIKASELHTVLMVAGRERKISTVIDNGDLKEWVGIGWITIRKATPSDYKRYRVVVEDEPTQKRRRKHARRS